MGTVIKKQTAFRIYVACLAMSIWTVTPLAAADSDAESVFYVDRNTLTPVMEKYLDAVREKIRQRGSRDWPEDIDGTKIPGEVVVQIVLKKNGYIKDLHVSVAGEGAAGRDTGALKAAVEVRVRNAQPFAPFPPRTFNDYEFVSLGTTVTAPQLAGVETGKPNPDIKDQR